MALWAASSHPPDGEPCRKNNDVGARDGLQSDSMMVVPFPLPFPLPVAALPHPARTAGTSQLAPIEADDMLPSPSTSYPFDPLDACDTLLIDSNDADCGGVVVPSRVEDVYCDDVSDGGTIPSLFISFCSYRF